MYFLKIYSSNTEKLFFCCYLYSQVSASCDSIGWLLSIYSLPALLLSGVTSWGDRDGRHLRPGSFLAPLQHPLPSPAGVASAAQRGASLLTGSGPPRLREGRVRAGLLQSDGPQRVHDPLLRIPLPQADAVPAGRRLLGAAAERNAKPHRPRRTRGRHSPTSRVPSGETGTNSELVPLPSL